MHESSRGRFDRRGGHRRRDREHGEGSRQQRKAGIGRQRRRGKNDDAGDVWQRADERRARPCLVGFATGHLRHATRDIRIRPVHVHDGSGRTRSFTLPHGFLVNPLRHGPIDWNQPGSRCSVHLIVVNTAPCGRAHAAVVDTEGTSVGKLDGRATDGAWGSGAACAARLVTVHRGSAGRSTATPTRDRRVASARPQGRAG